LTPDEEDPSITHVDSDAEEGDEVEGEEAEEEEEEVRDSKKRSREETDLEDGWVSSSNVTPEEPHTVEPPSFRAPPSGSAEKAKKKPKTTYACISSNR
jgi:hypothetical protein